MGGRLSPAADDHILRDGPVEELFTFYYCHRATLRARLAIAHLLEEHPRTPEKWPRLCATYLDLAKKSARRLVRAFRIHQSAGQLRSSCRRRIASLSRGAPQDNRAFYLLGLVEPERRHGVGDDDLVDRGIRQDVA